jgi:prepilin-type N-terminal cleavage/methylation domain-containing protein
MSRLSGFSLIEMIIAISIMVVFTAIALPNFSRLQSNAKSTATILIAQSLQIALESTYLENGHYPSGSSLMVDSLVTTINNSGAAMLVPENPYTGSAYLDSDANGRIIYTQKNNGAGYELRIYGIGSAELKRINQF